MTGDEERKSETLPVDALERIERACRDFEAAWKRGETPSLEEALGKAAGLERTLFFRELLLLELDYRRRRGQFPRAADYAARFFEDAALVEAAFASPEEPLLSPSSEAAGEPAVLYRSLDPKSLLGTRIGPYKLLDVLGDGGMGVVYLAEQQAPIRRRVALKLIKRGMDTAEVIARFEVERQALALMNHPNIAKVYDAGTTEDGRPYFVMEHVPGEQITSYCDRQRLSTKERLALFMEVCQAVQHAHQKAVIHRDLKPSNVLVMVEGGKPIPKVIDFGVAKATNQRLTEKTVYTELGQIIGTPEYMSPEQAEMSAVDIDTRTDIYSLGVMLYELIVGVLPFDRKLLREAGYAEIQRIIREKEPQKPSTRLSGLGKDSTLAAEKRRTDPGRLVRELRGDLDWIAMKALEKDRTRRYSTASELAADITRHLSHEPVLAGPPSPGYRLAKYVRRNRGPIAATLAVIVTLLVGLVASLNLYVKAERNATLAEGNATQAKKSAEDARQSARAAEERGEEARRNLGQAQANLYLAHVNLAAEAVASGDASRAEDLLLAEVPKAGEEDRRGFEWYHLIKVLHGERRTLHGHTVIVHGVAFFVDGKLLASASHDGSVKLWDALTGLEVHSLAAHSREAYSVAFSPDGARLATCGADRRVKIWRLASATEEHVLFGHSAAVNCVAFSPDGAALASASGDGTVRLWSAAIGEARFTLRGHEGAVSRVAFSPDGATLASAALDKTVRLWDVRTGEERLCFRGHGTEVYSVAFSPDGETVASGDLRGVVKLWDPATAREKATMWGHVDLLANLAFSPDGRSLASAGWEGKVTLWDPATAKETRHVSAHRRHVRSVAFSPDSGFLATAGDDGLVKLWDATISTEPTVLRAHSVEIRGLTFSPSGKLFATTSMDGTAKLWDTETGASRFTLIGHAEGVRCAAFSPDGTVLATGSDDDTAKLWDVESGQDLRTLRGHTDNVYSVAFSPDGMYLASASRDSTVRVWSLASVHEPEGGDAIQVLRGHTAEIWDVAFSPDGKLFASGSWDGTVRLWDPNTWESLGTIPGNFGRVSFCEFSPDSGTLAIQIGDGSLMLWDPALGKERRRFKSYWQHTGFAALSLDGKVLATGSTPGPVRLLDPATGEERGTLKGPTDIVMCTSFSPDSRTLAASSKEGMVYLWHGATDGEVARYARERLGKEEAVAAEKLWRPEDPAPYLAAYERAIELEPHRAYIDRGQMAYKLAANGWLADGVVQYRKAIEANPRFAAGHRGLVRLLRTNAALGSKGELSGLRAILERAVRDGTSDFFIFSTLAWVSLRDSWARDPARAVEYARKAVAQSGGKDPEAFEALAEALDQDGNKREAFAALEVALRLSSANSLFSRRLEELRRAVAPDLATYASIDDALEGRSVLIGAGDTWRFFRGKTEPPDGWMKPGFDDSSWEEGPSGFGYGRHDAATVLSDMQGSYSSVYIRRELTAPDRAYAKLTLSVRVDDGFVAYLNGSEVGRLRAGRAGSVTPHDQLADDVAPEPLMPKVIELDIALVHPGKNVLALHGLNQRLHSSDLSLEPVLLAEFRDDNAEDSRFLEAFRGAARGDDARRRVAYLEGRVLARSGRHAEAAAKLAEAAAGETFCPEPHLRLAESLQAAGKAAEAEAALRGALASSSMEGKAPLWDLWIALSLSSLRLEPREMLRIFPPGWEEGPADAVGRRADLRAALRQLAERGSVMILRKPKAPTLPEETERTFRRGAPDRIVVPLPDGDYSITYLADVLALEESSVTVRSGRLKLAWPGEVKGREVTAVSVASQATK